MTAENSALNF